MEPLATRISIKVVPGAKNNSIAGFGEGTWRVKITAPPVDGRANEKLVAYLSRVLDVRKSAISISSGQSGRIKTLSIDGLSANEINERLKTSQD